MSKQPLGHININSSVMKLGLSDLEQIQKTPRSDRTNPLNAICEAPAF